VIFSPIVGKLRIRRPTVTLMVGLGILGLFIMAMSVARSFWPFLLLQAACGICVPFADVPINTYLQKSIPDAYRGRVNSVLSMIATGIMPLGMAMAGVVVAGVGLSNTFVIMGLGMVGGMMLGFLSPEFRNARMPEEALPPTSGLAAT
jgi:DHA3 family macrolide efflux protein-like MFS transporter